MIYYVGNFSKLRCHTGQVKMTTATTPHEAVLSVKRNNTQEVSHST